MNFLEKIFKRARAVKLEKQKKDSIRESVLMYMKENPLPACASRPAVETRKFGFWNLIFSPRLKPAYITVSSLALVLLIAGSVSVQAQSALPGDPLYSVKTGVNEKILQVLAFSDQAKTELSLQLVDTRLQEAEKLAVEGKITPAKQAEINKSFNAQANAVSKAVDKLNSEKMYNSAQKVSADFQASLNAHSKVLEKIKEIKDGSAKNQDSINTIINDVNSAAQNIKLKIKNDNQASHNNSGKTKQKVNDRIRQADKK